MKKKISLKARQQKRIRQGLNIIQKMYPEANIILHLIADVKIITFEMDYENISIKIKYNKKIENEKSRTNEYDKIKKFIKTIYNIYQPKNLDIFIYKFRYEKNPNIISELYIEKKEVVA